MLIDGDHKHGGGGLTTPHGKTLIATGKIVKVPGGDFTGWDIDYKW
ncbi:hypothetical protein [Kribbella monticola]|nr:hypothetical protein [Kribbella monticola]